MKVVAIIPARGGSKGVPRKNLRDVAGKPLIAWSIEDAAESKIVSEVYVTTDDSEIAQVSIRYGAKVINRPADLAMDSSTSESALRHALDEIVKMDGEPRLVVFLQATSPLRSDRDIDAAIELLEKSDADSVLSVTPAHVFLWKEEDGKAVAINYDSMRRPRRQDMVPQYRENGSLYVFKPWVLRDLNNRLGGRIVMYKMGDEAGLDIDSELDLKIAGLLMQQETEVSS